MKTTFGFYIVVLLLLMTGFSNLFRINGEPKSEWAKTLIGEWSFSMTQKNEDNTTLYKFSGDVIYSEKGTFKKTLVGEEYYQNSGNVKVKQKYLINSSTGAISGDWFGFYSGKFWIEYPEHCHDKYINGDLNICSWYKSSIKYGKQISSGTTYRIEQFNRNEIIVRGSEFDGNETYSLIMKKKENKKKLEAQSKKMKLSSLGKLGKNVDNIISKIENKTQAVIDSILASVL